MNISINIKRLMKNIEELGKIGENVNGGINRSMGSQADEKARQWLHQYWKAHLQLEEDVDAAANMWLTWSDGQSLLPIAIGSHHDSVPDGGKYDGALGVLMATEILETLKEKRWSMRHPLTVVSFTGEEPNPYNVSTFGSKVVSGRLIKNDLEHIKNRDTGETIMSTLMRLGGNLDELETARLNQNCFSAYLECHIEQGHRLEDLALSVAVVSDITGIYREAVRICGESNHAGTTRIEDRKDAFLSAGELAIGLEKIVKQYDNIVATVGYVKISPNEANIIPGVVELILDIRTCSSERLNQVLIQLGGLLEEIGQRRKVEINRQVILNQEPVPMDKEIKAAVAAGCLAVGEPETILESMAGHDAANMAKVTRSGMIFVQSVNGKSHCKEEYTRPADIEKAGNAMLAAILELDWKLN